MFKSSKSKALQDYIKFTKLQYMWVMIIFQFFSSDRSLWTRILGS